MSTRARNLLDYKVLGHSHVTARKVIYFGVVSLVGAGIVAGGTYILTEWLGFYYIWSTALAGAIAFGIKFLLSALWTFKE